jgi:hypothetical protein
MHYGAMRGISGKSKRVAVQRASVACTLRVFMGCHFNFREFVG